MRLHWFGSLTLIASVALAAPPSTAKKPAVALPGKEARPAAAAAPVARAAPVSRFAPPSVPHPTAMFLASWSQEGKHDVSFKAAASGTRFFIEDRTGVSVYQFDGSGYVGEMFLPKATLATARKRFGGK